MRARGSIAILVASVCLVVAACGGQRATPTEPLTGRTPGPEDAVGNFEIIEIGLGPEGFVTLRNFTELASSPGALYLCQADQCEDLPDVVVDSNGVARIAVGDGEGLEDVIVKNAMLDLAPADGEVALTESTDARNVGAMRAYVQWGSTPHELTNSAERAGVWPEDGFAPSAAHATRLLKTEGNLWVWEPGT